MERRTYIEGVPGFLLGCFISVRIEQRKDHARALIQSDATSEMETAIIISVDKTLFYLTIDGEASRDEK